MNQISILAALLLLTAPCLAEIEYRVVYMPGITADVPAPELDPSSGTYIDAVKTEALNRLAADGWEVIAVTGAVGADHAVYLQREIEG